MKNNRIRTFTDYIIQNRLQFFFTVLCLLLGLVIGSLSEISLSNEKFGSLNTYMDNFVSAYDIQPIRNWSVFGFSVYNNIKVLLFMWISGLWIGFIPVGLFQLGVKGYKLAFTSTFLVQAYGGRGVLLSLITVVPQVLFMFPMLITYMVFNINFSLRLRKLRQRGQFFLANKELMIKNLIFLVVAILIILLCSLVDAFVVPAIIKPVCTL